MELPWQWLTDIFQQGNDQLRLTVTDNRESVRHPSDLPYVAP